MEKEGVQETIAIPYLEMGSGFLIGLAVGYFLKKSFKLLLIISGLILVALFVLENQGIIVINEANLHDTVAMGSEGFQSFLAFLKQRLGHLPVAGSGSAVAGMVVGLKWG